MELVLKLLVVEDVHEMRLWLEAVLTEDVAGEPSPKLAVTSLAPSVLSARQEWSRLRPDAVLLDEILPGESALDLLGELHAEGVPVVLLTGVEEPRHPLPAGARARLTKPSSEARSGERRAFRDAIRKVILTEPPRHC